MNNSEETLRLNLLVGNNTATPAIKALNKEVRSISDVLNNSLGKKNFDFNKQLQIDVAATSAKRLGKEIAENEKKQAAYNEQLQKFDMRWLSVMFTGMMVSRTFTAAYRAIENTYEKAAGNTTQLGQATMGLSASWEFLKFSIFNALDQPSIRGFIDNIIGIINWTSDLINKYPELGVAILGAFGVLALGGQVATWIGGLAMFWISMFGPFGFFPLKAAAGMGTAAAEAGSVAGAVKTGFDIWKNIIGPGLMIYGVFKTVKDIFGKEEITSTDMLIAALFAGVGAAVTFGGVAGFITTLTVMVAYEQKAEAQNRAAIQQQLSQYPESMKGSFADPAKTGTVLPTGMGGVNVNYSPFPDLSLSRFLQDPSFGTITKSWGELWDWLTSKGTVVQDYSNTLGAISERQRTTNELMDIAAKTVIPNYVGSEKGGLIGLDMTTNTLSNSFGQEKIGLGPRIDKTSESMNIMKDTAIPDLIIKNNDLIESNRSLAESYREIQKAQSEAYSSAEDTSTY